MATQQQLANYVQTTLASGCTSGATTISVVSAAGLPTAGNFMLRIDDASPATTFEFVECTGVSGTTLTVTRGQEGTTGIAHSAGAFVGNDLTAAMIQRAFPLGLMPGGLAQVNNAQSGIVAATDLTGLTVTVTPINASRRVKLTAFVPIAGSVAGDTYLLQLFEGTTQIALAKSSAIPAGGQGPHFHLTVTVNPTFAAHTYKLTASRIQGTGGMSVDAGANPALLMAEDIGQA